MSDSGKLHLRVQYSRKGKLHRWRLFTCDVQISTGTEWTIEEARAAAKKSRDEYKRIWKGRSVNIPLDAGWSSAWNHREESE